MARGYLIVLFFAVVHVLCPIIASQPHLTSLDRKCKRVVWMSGIQMKDFTGMRLRHNICIFMALLATAIHTCQAGNHVFVLKYQFHGGMQRA
jgi:hypothetical protein